MKLDGGAAEMAIRPASPSRSASVRGAAWGIHDIVNETMASAARLHIAEKRRGSARNLTLVAFGGAGPMHAIGIARKLGCPGGDPAAAAGVAVGLRPADRADGHRAPARGARGCCATSTSPARPLTRALETEAAALLAGRRRTLNYASSWPTSGASARTTRQEIEVQVGRTEPMTPRRRASASRSLRSASTPSIYGRRRRRHAAGNRQPARQARQASAKSVAHVSSAGAGRGDPHCKGAAPPVRAQRRRLPAGAGVRPQGPRTGQSHRRSGHHRGARIDHGHRSRRHAHAGRVRHRTSWSRSPCRRHSRDADSIPY